MRNSRINHHLPRRHQIRQFGAFLIITSAVLAVGIVGLTPPTPAKANAATVWKNSDVTAVSVGGSHTCAIETGVLFCWGAGTSGQLGYAPPARPPVIPPPTDQSKPIRVASVTGFPNTNVSAVSTGGSSTCAIENKVLFCWGSNGSGQVGNGRNTQQNTPAKVSAANGFLNNDVTAVSVGGLVTCAVESAVVYCWGANGLGAVGDGSTTHRNVPVKVLNNDGFVNSNVTAVGTGLTSCAVRNGSVTGELFCWGAGSSGQMGNGTTTNANPLPRKVSSGTDGFANSGVTSVRATGVSVCATRDESSNKVMYCWGNGGYGNFGIGSQANHSTPRKVSAANGFTNTAVTSAQIGDASCAVEGGVVYCFGINWFGQVGDGTTTQRTLATKVLAGGGMLNAGAVTMVSAYTNHACAIENKAVFCWGQAANGRLGNGETTPDRLSPVTAASLPGTPTISGATVGTTTAMVTVSAGAGGVPTFFTVTASAVAPATGTFTVTTSVGVPAAFTGLTENTTYTFTATATSDQGTSTVSAPVQRTTGFTAAPGNPIVDPGNSQLVVTIDPTTSGGTPTGYIATVDPPVNPPGGSCTVIPPATSCTITGLTNGTAYTVTTSAYNDAGSSPSSGGTTVTVGPPDPPLAPTIAVASGSATVTVNPTTSGGTPTSYTVTASAVAPGTGTFTCTATAPNTTCTVAGLTNGTTYDFTTSASNTAGTSEPSPTETNLVDILPIPLAPTVVLAMNGVTVSVSSSPSGGTVTTQSAYIQPGGLTCTVTSPDTSCFIPLPGYDNYTVTTSAVNGLNSPVTSSATTFDFASPGVPLIGVLGIATGSATVTVSAGSPGGPPSSYVVYVGPNSCEILAPDTSCTVTGLTAPGPFDVTASAINALGSTTSATLTVELIPPAAPGTPSVSPGNGSATITISPTTSGGLPSSYVVWAMPGNHFCTVTVPNTTCTITGLTNGITYTVTSSAVNAYGTSEPSSPIEIFVDAPPVVNLPTTVVGSGGVTVSSTLSTSGGSGVTFSAYVQPGDLSCTFTSPDTSCFIPLPGTGTYTVTVSAANDLPSSGTSPSLEFQYNAPPPPIVQNVVIGLGQVTVSVTASAGATTGATSFYTVFVGPSSCSVVPPSTSCSITDLTGGQVYPVTASATNGIGSTPSINSLNARMLPPNPPPAPGVFLNSSTSATVLVVDPPPNDGELPSSFTVTATSSAGVTVTCTVTRPDFACDLDGLTGGQLYSFSVVANNAYGPSSPGTATSALLVEPPTPGAPLVVPGDGRATVTVVPGSGGGPATEYVVTVEPGPFTCDDPIRPPNLSCVITGLTNDVEYTFTVIAANGVGESTVSATTVATPRRPVLPPTLVSSSILRFFGADRYGTAVSLSYGFGVVAAPAVYVASGTSFADALVAGSYAANTGGSVLLVERDRVSSQVLAELRRLSPREVVLVGGATAISSSVEQTIIEAGFAVRRVAGADRFATAVELSRRAYPRTASTVYIASGEVFADAMPSGVLAAIDDGPVLLVNSDRIPAATAAELARLRPQRIVIVGGVNAVGSSVQSALAAYSSRVTRVSGADRYETAVALSQSRFQAGVPVAFLVSGENFPDALAAVAPAGRLGGPILLTRSTCVPVSVRNELSRLQPGRIIIIGGGSVLTSRIDSLTPCL